MSTYFAIRQATDSGHPLDRRLRGYCRDKLPWVPWATGYGPKLLDTTGLLQRHMVGRPHTVYQGATLPLTN
jgi:hypothetical protein